MRLAAVGLLLALSVAVRPATGHYSDLNSCRQACEKTSACGEGIACRCGCCGAFGDDPDGCYCFSCPTLATDDYGRLDPLSERLNNVTLNPEPNYCPGTKQRCSTFQAELADPISRYNQGEDPGRAAPPGSAFSHRPANQIQGWTVEAFFSAIQNASKVAAIAAGQADRVARFINGTLGFPKKALDIHDIKGREALARRFGRMQGVVMAAEKNGDSLSVPDQKMGGVIDERIAALVRAGLLTADEEEASYAANEDVMEKLIAMAKVRRAAQEKTREEARKGEELKRKVEQIEKKMEEEAAKAAVRVAALKVDINDMKARLDDIAEKSPELKNKHVALEAAVKAEDTRVGVIRGEFEKVEDSSMSLHDVILSLEQKCTARFGADWRSKKA